MRVTDAASEWSAWDVCVTFVGLTERDLALGTSHIGMVEIRL